MSLTPRSSPAEMRDYIIDAWNEAMTGPGLLRDLRLEQTGLALALIRKVHPADAVLVEAELIKKASDQ